jgi:hypothetical protein
MARYQDPDVTPRQARLGAPRPDRSSPVGTGAASLPPAPRNLVLPALITQLSDRLKRGPRQLWCCGRLARAGANLRPRGGITGWPVATVRLCAWMTPGGLASLAVGMLRANPYGFVITASSRGPHSRRELQETRRCAAE